MKYQILWNEYKITDMIYKLKSAFVKHESENIGVSINIASNFKILKDLSKVYNVNDVSIKVKTDAEILQENNFKIIFPIKIELDDSDFSLSEDKEVAKKIIEKLPSEIQGTIKIRIADIASQMSRILGEDIGYPGEEKILSLR